MAVAVSDVKKAITRVVSRTKNYERDISRLEICTRYAVIDPILVSLDWRLWDVCEVQVEYLRNGGFVDYALFNNNKNPAIIVEAKSLNNDLTAEHERQLQGYARGIRPGYAVLTNGKHWKIWDLKDGKFKFDLELYLLDDTPQQCAKELHHRLNRLLHYKR